jgi:uncharacterized RDD family membrane protein YckC
MSHADENIYIETPESVTLEANVAGFGSRILAAIIDYLIISAALAAFFCMVSNSIRAIDDPGRLAGIAILVLFAIFTFYHLVFELAWNGQTPGKHALKLRVVQASGMPVTVNGVLIRNLVRLFDMLPALYGIGLISMFVTKHTQRLGDLAAHTIVVQERSQLNLATVREDYHVHYIFVGRDQELPDYVRIGVLTEQDRRTVISYLQRRHEINGRESVAVMLARRIGEAMGIHAVPYYPFASLSRAEEFLEQVARAFELVERRPED